MASIILDFEQPKECHSPVISLMQAILQPENNAKHNEWFLSNYINLYVNKVTCEDQFYSRRNFFVDCPFIQMCVINMDKIESLASSPITFFKKCLELGYYLYVVVKTGYISAYDKDEFCDPNYSHNMLIYGFDDSDKVFYVADHFSRNGLYSARVCTYDELHVSLDVFKANNPYYFNMVRAFRVVNAKYQFELDPLVRRIKYHYNSKNLFDEHMQGLPDSCYDGHKNNIFDYVTYEKRKEEYVFGLNIYDYLITTIQDGSYLDPRSRLFQLLYMHKFFMVKRVNLLAEHNFLRDAPSLMDKAHQLLKMTEALRNQYLKARILSQKSDIVSNIDAKLLEKVQKIHLQEKVFLEDLLESIVV